MNKNKIYAYTKAKKILCKTQLIMLKTITLLIFIEVSCIYASSTFSQAKIDINLNGETIESLFKEIQSKSEFIFFYPSSVLQINKKIYLKKQDATVQQILNQAFKELSLSYKIFDKQIVVTHQNKASTQEQSNFGVLQKAIKGKVSDKSGFPLPGVSIVKQGTSTGVSTNFDGEFEIAASKGNKLIITFIGMKTKTITVKDELFLNIALEDEIEELDGIVVTGYRNINKKAFTGASQTIKAEDVVIDGLIDPGRMLEGRAAGVNVQNITGTFGAAPKITIRGGSSIFGDTKPLWVIDGAVQEEIVNLSFDQLVSGDSATLISSAIAGLNANDIESIEILKDASALSLYGARALNGAVIISTKSGNRNTPSAVSYQAEYTIRSIPSYVSYNLLNSQETMGIYKEMYNKGFLRLSSTTQGRYGGVYNLMYRAINTYNPSTGEFFVQNTLESRNAFLKQYEMANTDWFKILFRQIPTQNHTLSFTGGGKNTSQYASLGFYTDPGWSIADKISRITANLRGAYYLSDKVNAGILIQGSIREQKAPGTYNRQSTSVYGEYTRDFDINPFSYALNTSRTLRPYDNSGNLEYYRYNWAPLNILNEIENNTINLRVIDLKLQGNLNLKLYKNFDYSFLGSVRYVNSIKEHNITENSNVVAAYRANETTIVANDNIFLFTDPDDPVSIPQVVLNEGGILNQNTDNLKSFYLRNALDFTKKLDDKQSLKLYLGQEYRHTDRENSFFTGFGYQYNRGGIPFTNYQIIKMSLLNDTDYFGKTFDRERGIAFFGQSSYSFNNKYIISATVNYEGSNKLGRSTKARWLPTWNISGKWNASNENILKNNPIISNLSLRLGYGLIAGLGTADNALSVFRNDIANRFSPEDRENLIDIIDLENSELTWEKLYETNMGLDLGLYKNKINLSVDVYCKKSFDLIDFVRTSGIGGEFFKLANNADMSTKGLEASLLSRNVNADTFKWSTTFNFAWFNQKITKLQSEPNVLSLVRDVGGSVVGYQRNSIFSFDFTGLNNQGVPTYYFDDGRNPITGVDFQETSNILNYLKYEGPVEPNLTGGLSNTFSFKNWELSSLITWQAGNKIRLTPIYSSRYSDLDVFPSEFKNRWSLIGDKNITDIPVLLDTRLNSKYGRDIRRTYNAYNFSTERVVDGSFVRMKNIALTYKFSKELKKRLKISRFVIRVQATNPFLVYSDSDLNGQDPEFFRAGGVAYPIQKQYTLTLNVGL
ncbi:MAG: SusC/RagA family TonB-linked outer membrane protein [Tenacibaculum sp.]